MGFEQPLQGVTVGSCPGMLAADLMGPAHQTDSQMLTLMQGIKTYVFAAPLGKNSEICPMPHKAGQYASFDFEVRKV